MANKIVNYKNKNYIINNGKNNSINNYKILISKDIKLII